MIFHDMYIVKTVFIFEVKALTIKSIFMKIQITLDKQAKIM